MPHVMERDRPALAAFLERSGRLVPDPLDYVPESVWAEHLTDRNTFEPIDEAPRDGTRIEVLYDDGTTEEDVYWAETRQCMLGSRAGEQGAGWMSTEAGLPVGDGPHITHYRLPGAAREAWRSVT
jgi:hypothetical protein